MAQGKLSARQKMINLMYLIFIAMLALNMSKEVLSAFGLMNEKLTESNTAATQRNTMFLTSLEQQASEQPDKYRSLKAQADQVSQLANNLNTYLEGLKGNMTAKLDDPQDYEIMDKGDYLDESFFKGDKLKPEGQEFLDKIAAFKNGIEQVIGVTYPSITSDVKKKFATEQVINRDGIKVDWLDYHYKGFPLVASLTKMTQLQADVKTTESEVMSTMLQGKLKFEASLTNFEAIVVPSKTAFFNGENFTGKIILGKKDVTLTADKVVVNGQELPAESMQAGQTILDFPAGSIGENEIKGKFTFTEGGEPFDIDFETSYSVVPKPNSATISADKMNVVYRGVTNPMTISFAGISDNNVSASAAGLSKAAGVGKYNMRPASGREVTINVTGTLPDGTKVPSSAKFRIKDLPKPVGQVAGKDGKFNLPRKNLEVGRVQAKFLDFDFDLPLRVTSFKFKAPGQPSVTCQGNKLSSQAKNALRKAKRGANVQIFEIRSKPSGSGPKIKTSAPIIIQLTD